MRFPAGGVGLDLPRERNRHVWETIEQDKPDLWNEFKSDDVDAMIDERVQFKQVHYEDRRRILTCGMADGKTRVEWLRAAAPGVDSKWEMRLYCLVRMGQREQRIGYLQETRSLKRKEAAKQVEVIAAQLGVK